MTLLLLAACGDDSVLPEPVESDRAPTTSASLLTCSKGNFAQFFALWDCSQTVQFYAPAGQIRIDAALAAAEWQQAADISGLPQFYTTTDLGSASAQITDLPSGATSPYCGEWSDFNKVLTLKLGSTCNHPGGLQTLLRHEFAHAFGWTGTTAHVAGQAGASDHCAIFLGVGQPLNSSICAHEIEGAAAAYGLRSLPSDFWSKEFVVGSVNTLSATSVAAGNTVTLSPGNWRLDRGGSTSGTYTWTSSNTAVATVSGGVVTGVAAGTTTITAHPSTSGSSYLFTTAFTTNGVSATVTVTNTPVNLYVTGITGAGGIDTMPIHDPGSYLLTAHLGAGDDTGVTFKWTIIFSNAIGDSVVSHADTMPPWGPRTRSITVPSPIGTYTITARVRAGRDTTVGSVTSHDFAVCPRPIGNDLKDKTDDGGNGTDAVGQC